MTDARRIYQETLDRLTAAILARDPVAFSKGIYLPHEARAMNGSTLCRTEEDVQKAMLTYANSLQDHKVTHLSRVCDTAHRVNAGQISGYHTTRIEAEAPFNVAPFLTRMSLYLEGTDWKVAITETALDAHSWPMKPVWDGMDGDSHRDAATSDKAQRLRLFQTILDRISACFLSGDIEGWLGCITLPCHLVTRHGIDTYETEDAVRSDFAVYAEEFKTHGVTDIIREAKTAELIDGDQMTGTYATHILRGATHVVPPWDASMTLRQQDGLWRVTTVMRAIGHLNWAAITPSDIEDTPHTAPISAFTKKEIQ